MKDGLYYWLCYHWAGVQFRVERLLWRLWRGIGVRAGWIDREDMPLTMGASMIETREVPAVGVRCEDCGALGAYDFMGDWLCARCAGTDWWPGK